MAAHWTTDDSRDLYNLDRWGLGFFDINEQGQLVACLGENQEKKISVVGAVEAARELGLKAPFVVRFPDIIRMRIDLIYSSFAEAIEQFEYGGTYRCFYPAKVNQHRDVIATAIDAGRVHGGGVEAGSKAELLALLLMTDNDVPILCNGFKDQSIIELALRGMQLGRSIKIVLEKPEDLRMVLETSRKLGVKPSLGVRVKLAARSGGRWNASGGSKSKFGLNVSQVLNVVERLRDEGMLDCLELLHFHPGSQISNVRKIKSSIVEAARVYADLVANGVPLKIIDVGGGLAIDYTGERNQDPSSKNYSLQEYANDVVYYIQQVCRETKVAEPDIYSESGRAITAHHSLLVVPVLDESNVSSKRPDSALPVETVDENTSSVIKELTAILDTLHPRNLSESFHDAQAAIEAAWQMFSLGGLSLKERSSAELLFDSICREVSSMVESLEFVPRELEQLRHQLAETYIANFSLFQAIPDAWAINQVFPVAPLHRLNERPGRRAVIGDITCDSDGTIDCFIGSKGGRNSLPVHALNDEPYYIGIFLIGAYQEALSDDHNLMGNFHVLSVGADGQISTRKGASVLEVLEHVNHQRNELHESLESSIAAALKTSQIAENDVASVRRIFESVMASYTYLDRAPVSKPAAQPHIQLKQQVTNSESVNERDSKNRT